MLELHQNLVVHDLRIALHVRKSIHRRGPDIRLHENIHQLAGGLLGEPLFEFPFHVVAIRGNVARIVSFESAHAHQFADFPHRHHGDRNISVLGFVNAHRRAHVRMSDPGRAALRLAQRIHIQRQFLGGLVQHRIQQIHVEPLPFSRPRAFIQRHQHGDHDVQTRRQVRQPDPHGNRRIVRRSVQHQNSRDRLRQQILSRPRFIWPILPPTRTGAVN